LVAEAEGLPPIGVVTVVLGLGLGTAVPWVVALPVTLSELAPDGMLTGPGPPDASIEKEPDGSGSGKEEKVASAPPPGVPEPAIAVLVVMGSARCWSGTAANAPETARQREAIT
jgi:hypothetical protein